MEDSNDEYDFVPSESSKLSSLFGATMLINPMDNSNLTYTAPKQPKKVQNNTPQKISSSTIVAKVINLWKIENSKDKTPYGKHGMAIVSVNADLPKDLIIYKNKNAILVRCQLDEQSFTWHNYNNCFGAFYDPNKIFWMVKFESASEEKLFFNEFTLSKCKITLINNNNEQTNNTQTKTKETEDTKAEILTRITKMGQQILPKAQIIKSTTCESSSSSSDVETNNKNTTRHKPTVLPRKTKNNCNNITMLVPSQTNDMSMTLNPPTTFTNNNNDSFNNFLLMQNMEMKSSLNQLTSKLDAVLNQNCGSNNDLNVLKSKLKVLELQNSNLKSELIRFEDKATVLQGQYDSSIQELHQEKNRNVELENSKIEIQEKLERYNFKNLDGVLNEIESNKSRIKELSDEVLQLKEKLNESKTLSQDNKADIVKGHMNSLYQRILLSFDNDDMISSKIVKEIFAKNLKATTYNMLNDLGNENKILTD